MNEAALHQPTEQDLSNFRTEVRTWLELNKPSPPNFALPDSFMEVGTPEQFEYLLNWQKKVFDAGYIGIAWPAEYGGRGMHGAYQAVVDEEMELAEVPFMINVIGLNWAGPVILKLGTGDQKMRYIRNILSAQEIWCQGFSEPENGSDLGNAQMTAVREGDEYVLNGTKTWTSLGTQAHQMILLARTDPNTERRHAGLTFFLAPIETAGVDKRPVQKLTGEYGFTETHFIDVRVPADCILGREGQGWQVAMETLMFERGVAGGQAGGLKTAPIRVRDVLRMAHLCSRDGRPAIDDPGVRDQLVRFMIEERAAEMNDHRMEIPELIIERPLALPAIRKVMMTEFFRRLTQFSLSLQGARASLCMGDPDVFGNGHWQRHYLNSFSATIGGGTSQIQRNIVGERILGLEKG